MVIQLLRVVSLEKIRAIISIQLLVLRKKKKGYLTLEKKGYVSLEKIRAIMVSLVCANLLSLYRALIVLRKKRKKTSYPLYPSLLLIFYQSLF